MYFFLLYVPFCHFINLFNTFIQFASDAFSKPDACISYININAELFIYGNWKGIHHENTPI